MTGPAGRVPFAHVTPNQVQGWALDSHPVDDVHGVADELDDVTRSTSATRSTRLHPVYGLVTPARQLLDQAVLFAGNATATAAGIVPLSWLLDNFMDALHRERNNKRNTTQQVVRTLAHTDCSPSRSTLRVGAPKGAPDGVQTWRVEELTGLREPCPAGGFETGPARWHVVRE